MELHRIDEVFVRVQQDQRLKAWHIALLLAVHVMALQQGRKSRIQVSRSRLMLLSHITSLPTFHKYFTQLQQMNYIIYRPSYHPGMRSEIDIIVL